MISRRRVGAIVLRQFYLMRGSFARVLPLFAWVAVDIVLWGFLTVYWKALTEFSAVELIGYRVVSSFTLLAVMMVALRRLRGLLRSLTDRRLLGRVTMAALLLTGNWTAYVWAVLHRSGRLAFTDRLRHDAAREPLN